MFAGSITLKHIEAILRIGTHAAFLFALSLPAHSFERKQPVFVQGGRPRNIERLLPDLNSQFHPQSQNSDRLNHCVDTVKQMTGVDISAQFMFDPKAIFNSQIGRISLPIATGPTNSWVVPILKVHQIRNALLKPLSLPLSETSGDFINPDDLDIVAQAINPICRNGVDSKISEIICHTSESVAALVQWHPQRLTAGQPLLDLSLNGILAASAFEAIASGDSLLIATDVATAINASHALSRSLDLLLYADRSSVDCTSEGQLIYSQGHEFSYLLWKLDHETPNPDWLFSNLIEDRLLATVPWLKSVGLWSYVGSLIKMDIFNRYSHHYEDARERAISRLMSEPFFEELFAGTQIVRNFPAWDSIKELRNLITHSWKSADPKAIESLLLQIQRSTPSPDLVRHLLVLVDIAEEARNILSDPEAARRIEFLKKNPAPVVPAHIDLIQSFLDVDRTQAEEALLNSALLAAKTIRHFAANQREIQ